MGLERHGAALFLKLWADRVAFGRVLTLGRQSISLNLDEYCRALRRVGHPDIDTLPNYADNFFSALGAEAVVAMDFSPYEGAQVIHDLNQPVPSAWHQHYDLIFDGGTLEHVFEFPNAIRNCMQMLKPGGRFVSVATANNWCGHGFYQFSPELFYRIFADGNGFRIVEMYMAEIRGRVYAVKDPALVGSRVELRNDMPVYLLVHAQRNAASDVFVQYPQQSDYQTAWQVNSERRLGHPSGAWKRLPAVKQLVDLRQKLRNRLELRKSSLANRQFYTPIDLRI